MKHLLLVALIITLTPLLPATRVTADVGDRPLLIEGKRSLYQRVLSIPGARLASEPGGQMGEAVVPFTAFYVYARREQGGSEWIEVGTGRHNTRAGWLPTAKTLDWNHGLTAAFRDPAGHDRVLLFDEPDSLRQLVKEQGH